MAGEGAPRCSGTPCYVSHIYIYSIYIDSVLTRVVFYTKYIVFVGVAVGAQTVCRLSWKFLRASPCACHAGAVLLEPPARAYAKPLRRFINKHFSFTDFKDVKSRKGAKAYSQHTVNTVNRQFLFPFAFFLYTEDIQALSAPRLPHRARLTRRAP